MVTISLTKQIEAHGQPVKQIILREPTAGDINKVGLPFDMTSDGKIITNARCVSEYIARLGNIPPSSVEMLAVVDWVTCMGEVMGFFGNAPATS